MKKNLFNFIGLLTALIMMPSFVSCGDNISSEIHNEHSYGEWTITKEPTCTENGEESRICSICGKEETRSVGANGHSYGVWKHEIEPTCTTEGKEIRECTNCGAKETRSIEKIEHSYGVWKHEIEPTCTTEGKEICECTNCGDKQEKNLPIVDHVYEDGKCKWCGLPEKTQTINNNGKVKANVNYGGAGASDWIVDVDNGIYKSNTNLNANLTFLNWEFEGGIIEWDMTIAENAEYKFSTACGITFASLNDNMIGGNYENDNYYCFGRAFTGEYVGYSKQNGNFIWQDYAKLSSITCQKGVKNHFKLEYDNINHIIYLTYGEQNTFFVPSVKLNGKYFGLYSEAEGTIFENITINKQEYTLSTISPMNQSLWKEEKSDNNTLSYKALSDICVGVLKGIEFTTGSIEWDMLVPEGNFAFNVMCGIIWGAESDILNIYNSQYLCSGMYPSGIFVSYSKVFNGTSTDFRWENASQIVDENIMQRNIKVHYKFTYDGTNLILEVGDKTATLQPTVNPFGTNIALYSELAGTTFSNITITPLAS